MATFGQCENVKLSNYERCTELVMVLEISDVDHMGRQRENLCQSCSASTAAFIAHCDAAFRQANAWNPDYAGELDGRQTETRRRTRELNLANDRRRTAVRA